MGWATLSGENKMFENKSGFNNEVQIKDGAKVVVQLVFDEVNKEPYTFFEHVIAYGDGENKSIRIVRCPKTEDNPNAYCPLCEAGSIKRRFRGAANVIDVDTNEVKQLSHGTQIWDTIVLAQKAGVDVESCKWALTRTGKGQMGTKYSAINIGMTEKINPYDYNLPSIKELYAPHTVEDIKRLVAETGRPWEEAVAPEPMDFPGSLNDALSHTMPRGKHSGKTMKSIWEEDSSPNGYIGWLALKGTFNGYEKACAQVILSNLGGVKINGVPDFKSNSNSNTQAKQQAPKKKNNESGERESIIAQCNTLISEKFSNDYEGVIKLVKSVGGGKVNVNDFSIDELKNLLDAVK